MLENVKYNLGRKYNFYTTISPGQRSKGGIAVSIRKDIAHKRLNIRTALQMAVLEVYLVGKGKEQYAQYIYFPTDQVTEEDLRHCLEQLPVPIILLGDFNAENPL